MAVKDTQIYEVRLENRFASQKIESRHFCYPQEKL